jgi:hypothetical protein
MKVGDLVVVNNSPFDGINLFNYQNGDIGIMKAAAEPTRNYMSCAIILLKDFKEYHIPISYLEKMEAPC